MGYSKSAKIVIDNTKVEATHTNFVIPIYGTFDGTGGEPDLRTVANGGDVENTVAGSIDSGLTIPADLIVSSDAGGASVLDHVVGKYNPATGYIYFWVKISSLSGSADTIIYLHYGDSGVTTNQEGTPFSGFRYITINGFEHDWSGNGWDGTLRGGGPPAFGGYASPKMGYATHFDGSDDGAFNGSITVSAQDEVTYFTLAVSDEVSQDSVNAMISGFDSGNYHIRQDGNNSELRVKTGVNTVITTSSPTQDVFFLVGGSYNKNRSVPDGDAHHVYFNGVDEASDDDTSQTPADSSVWSAGYDNDGDDSLWDGGIEIIAILYEDWTTEFTTLWNAINDQTNFATLTEIEGVAQAFMMGRNF